MKSALSILMISAAAMTGGLSEAAESDGRVIDRTLGCSNLELLLRIRHLDHSSAPEDRDAGQRLMLNSLTRRDCIVLEARAEVLREETSDENICVRPVGYTKCFWTEADVIDALSSRAPGASGEPSLKWSLR